jgi:hypothetical protein
MEYQRPMGERRMQKREQSAKHMVQTTGARRLKIWHWLHYSITLHRDKSDWEEEVQRCNVMVEARTRYAWIGSN